MAEKNCQKYLKIVDMIDYNDAFFIVVRTFLLIQRVAMPSQI